MRKKGNDQRDRETDKERQETKGNRDFKHREIETEGMRILYVLKKE